MAIIRRALLRLNETLALNHPIPFRSRFGPISRLSSEREFDISNEESKRRLYNRLLYRSRQRGFLELDLVLGNWVEENIHSMDEIRIRALADVLDLQMPVPVGTQPVAFCGTTRVYRVGIYPNINPSVKMSIGGHFLSYILEMLQSVLQA